MRLVLSASSSPLRRVPAPPLHKTSGPNFIMPWSNQSGGGGWKGGGPWGPRPSPGQQPDLEEFLRRSQDRLRQAMPGGRMGGPFAVLLAVVLIALVGFFGFTVRVNPDELGIVLRFGGYIRQLPPGLNFRS